MPRIRSNVVLGQLIKGVVHLARSCQRVSQNHQLTSSSMRVQVSKLCQPRGMHDRTPGKQTRQLRREMVTSVLRVPASTGRQPRCASRLRPFPSNHLLYRHLLFWLIAPPSHALNDKRRAHEGQGASTSVQQKAMGVRPPLPLALGL